MDFNNDAHTGKFNDRLVELTKRWHTTELTPDSIELDNFIFDQTSEYIAATSWARLIGAGEKIGIDIVERFSQREVKALWSINSVSFQIGLIMGMRYIHEYGEPEWVAMLAKNEEGDA